MKSINFTIIVLLLIIVSCSESHVKKQHKENLHKTHWTYEGETSPEHWAEIEKNSDCDGNRQSPVNIIDINTQKNNAIGCPLKINYSPKTQINKVENNGHSIQFNFEVGDAIQYQDETYDLAQIHFHEPAEHTIDGIRYPLEIHLVHTGKNGKYTVMSVLAKEGKESQIFEFLESFLPLKENESKEIHKPLDLGTLFPLNKEFYAYGGSLTTPPCSENVNWIVFKNPIIVSVEEVLKLKKNMPKNNYRNEQALNDRIISLNKF